MGSAFGSRSSIIPSWTPAPGVGVDTRQRGEVTAAGGHGARAKRTPTTLNRLSCPRLECNCVVVHKKCALAFRADRPRPRLGRRQPLTAAGLGLTWKAVAQLHLCRAFRSPEGAMIRGVHTMFYSSEPE